MQLSVTRDRYKGHAASPWLVVVPRRLSPSGKRVFRRFATKAAAANFAQMLTRQVRAEGERPLAAIPADLAADAAEAAHLLAGTGLTLTQAARAYLAVSRGGAVANAPYDIDGGAGAPGIPATPGATLPTVGEAYASMCESKAHLSAATQKSRTTAFKRLFRQNPGLADTPLAACTPAFLQSVLETSGNTPVNWNACHQQLSTLFNWALRKQLYHGQNPMLPIDRKHYQEKEITALPPADLRALFAACRPATPQERASGDAYDLTALRAYVAICAFAGVRPTECSRLRWQDVNLEENILSVRAANSKTGGTRHIPLHPTLRAWLTACMPADPQPTAPITSPVNLPLRTKHLHLRAGFGPHKPWQQDVLRHSFATYFLKAALGTQDDLRWAMGHTGHRLIATRYMNMAGITRAMATEWWQILPE
ncbi:MAG: site-specific integrase [Akkermansia sp.]|nr:site-specific integrase [Akkermansia sp.]